MKKQKDFKIGDLIRLNIELFGYKKDEIGILISNTSKIRYKENSWIVFVKDKQGYFVSQWISQSYFKKLE